MTDGLGFECTIEEVGIHGAVMKTENGKQVVDYISCGERITNKYKPYDEQNFKGSIYINKSWDNHKNSNENTSNSEYDFIRNYSFTLKRKT